MKYPLFLFLFILCFVLSAPVAYSQSPDQVTVTTYYPAPYGEYQQIRLTPGNTAANTACTNAGTMTFGNGHLLVCDGSRWQTVVTTDTAAAEQVWARTGSNIHLDPKYATHNIGIGTTNPGGKVGIQFSGNQDGLYMYQPSGSGRTLALHQSSTNRIIDAYYNSGGRWVNEFHVTHDGGGFFARQVATPELCLWGDCRRQWPTAGDLCFILYGTHYFDATAKLENRIFCKACMPGGIVRCMNLLKQNAVLDHIHSMEVRPRRIPEPVTP